MTLVTGIRTSYCILVLYMHRVYALPVLICSCMFLLQQVSYTTKTALQAHGFTIKNKESFTPGVVVLPRKLFLLLHSKDAIFCMHYIASLALLMI